MTYINIGTNKGILRNIKINKPFQDIKVKDIMSIIKKHFDNTENINIHGWADVTDQNQ